MMYDTPQKSYPNKVTSLREKIQSKLQTDKKILESKQNIFKQFQSYNKNPFHQTSNHNPINYAINRPTNDPQKEKEKFYSFSSNKKTSFEPLISEGNVLQYESLQNRNFYGFQEWLEFNSKFFPHVQEQTVKNLWKIMRIINYGDIWIPSGLIYEVSKVLTTNDNVQRSSLKHTFNQFLKFNHAKDQVNNFRELKSYPPFQQIEDVYLKVDKKDKNASLKKNKQYSSLKKLPENSSDVFERAHNESKLRNSRRSKMIYQSLIEKQIDEECVFKPKINKYCPQKLFVEETVKAPRSCHIQEKWMVEALQMQDLVQNNTFKAQPFERNKFQNTNLETIPGVAEYIERKRQSQSQKRKLERYNQRPSSVYRHYN